jgi:sensor domain CHASE-containing protein
MILKKPLLTALFVFVLILLLTQLAAYQHYLLYQSTRIKEEANAANLAKEKLETVLTNSITATQTLSFIVKQYGIHNDFDNVGRQILASSKYVDAVELTDGGEIKYVYPLKENATALGYNILKDSVQNIEAQKAIARGDIFFAGPLRLKQGGTGIVGRLPILVNGSFKGFAISLVKLSTLIKAAGLDNNTGDYIYQLSKINPRTNHEEFFLPGTGINAQKDIVFAYVPLGEWKIYVTQKHSPAFAALVPFSILGFCWL